LDAKLVMFLITAMSFGLERMCHDVVANLLPNIHFITSVND